MRIKLESETNIKTLSEGFEEFIRYCTIRNYSIYTIRNHKEAMRHFNLFYSKDNLISDITSKTIEDYVYFIKQNSAMSDVSIIMRLKNINAILNYFNKQGYIDKVETPHIRYEKKVKETYTDYELKLLLKKPQISKCNFSEYRNWVIINYLLSTGNRLSTLINIKISDVDFENSVIKLSTTKNKKQQLIPLSGTLSNILKEYLKYRKGNNDDFLFCNSFGCQFDRHGLQTAIKRYNTNRGVAKTSIHLFRHTFAKKWILSGGDIFRLQKILGHSSLDVVKEYVNMFSDDLQHDFNKFNALEQLVSNTKQIAL